MNRVPTDFSDAKYRGAATAVEPSFDPFQFRHRHLGPSSDDVRRMLRVVGAPTLDALIGEAIPGDIRQAQPLDFGPSLSEPELLAKMRDVASRNRPMTSLIGQGYYGTHLPAVIQRNVLENPGLVHGLHALSAGDQPGPARSTAQFPDHDRRPDRADDRQCLAARRSHGCGRGHGHGAARGAIAARQLLRRSRLPSADDCRREDPRRAAGLDRHRRRSRRISIRSGIRRPVPIPGSSGRSSTHRARDRTPACAAALSPSWPPILWR